MNKAEKAEHRNHHVNATLLASSILTAIQDVSDLNERNIKEELSSDKYMNEWRAIKSRLADSIEICEPLEAGFGK